MEEKSLDIVAITKRSIQSIVALISRQFIVQLISVAASVVVYTQLSPRENGIFAFVLSIQRTISFLTDFGLAAALVHKKEEIEQDDITTTFTVQAVVTGSIFLLVFFLRDVIATLFKLDQSGMWLLTVLVFTIFLSSFKMIPSVILERKIQFQKLIIPQIMEAIAFNGILVTMLIQGFGIMSYTWAFFISSIISIPVYYFISPWRISLGYNSSSLAHLKYGIQFQAKNVLATIKDDILVIVLKLFMPFEAIGYIRFGRTWAFFPFRFIVDSVTKVTFSTYSRIRDNMDHLRKAIEKSLFFVSVLMFPLLAGLAVTGSMIIQLIPKWHKWEPAVIGLIFFCFDGIVSSLSAILVNVLDSTGRVKTTLKLMIIWTILIWTLTPILIFFYGYNGAPIASFLVTLTIAYTIHLVKKTVPFHFFKSIYKPIAATVIMVLYLFIVKNLLTQNLLMLIFVILTGGAIYIFSIYILARQELTNDIKHLFKT